MYCLIFLKPVGLIRSKVSIATIHGPYQLTSRSILFLNTTFSLIIKNKQTLIRYCNASSFFFFRNGKTENYVNILLIIAILSPSASCRHRCWRLGFGTLSSKLLSSASRCCCYFVIFSSGVPSCGLVRRIILPVVVIVVVGSFIVGSVLLLL